MFAQIACFHGVDHSLGLSLQDRQDVACDIGSLGVVPDTQEATCQILDDLAYVLLLAFEHVSSDLVDCGLF